MDDFDDFMRRRRPAPDSCAPGSSGEEGSAEPPAGKAPSRARAAVADCAGRAPPKARVSAGTGREVRRYSREIAGAQAAAVPADVAAMPRTAAMHSTEEYSAATEFVSTHAADSDDGNEKRFFIDINGTLAPEPEPQDSGSSEYLSWERRSGTTPPGGESTEDEADRRAEEGLGSARKRRRARKDARRLARQRQLQRSSASLGAAARLNGWEWKCSDETGRSYWWNSRTGEARWTLQSGLSRSEGV